MKSLVLVVQHYRSPTLMLHAVNTVSLCGCPCTGWNEENISSALCLAHDQTGCAEWIRMITDTCFSIRVPVKIWNWLEELERQVCWNNLVAGKIRSLGRRKAAETTSTLSFLCPSSWALSLNSLYKAITDFSQQKRLLQTPDNEGAFTQAYPEITMSQKFTLVRPEPENKNNEPLIPANAW